MKSAFFLFIILVSASARGQAPAQASGPPAHQETLPSRGVKVVEKPAEAFVIESLHTTMRFENDGTGMRETAANVRVLSEAGVKQWGLLSVGYSSAGEDVTFPYIRVLKPDGTVISTPPENVQDTTAEITREAPMFSDYHEKHVTVRGLAAGDRLEYDVRVRIHTALVPNQFWTSYRFDTNDTVGDEQLEMNLPKDRYVNVKSTEVKPQVREENDRRIYLWKTSHQASAADQVVPDEIPPAPVQISTFRSREEVGRWWGALEEERAVPTPELTAKAAALTKDARTDAEKVQAIYNYVALNFRYVSISFGVGRYQPHAADDVFKNAYGDCKDKHTLLAALLKAAGIESESVLINSSLKLDPDVPSPGQFDHVISRVPLASGPVWLDTTTEVAPFGYLTFNLRDKQALVVRPGKPAVVMATPADPPFQSSQQVEVTGKLNEDGTLEAKMQWTVRNDSEIFLRLAFRNTPQDKWKDLLQALSSASGYGGEVSDVNVSPPDATASPLEFSYHYTRKDYPDWTANKRITTPLPPITLPALSDKPEDSQKPVKLGQPGEVTLRASIELPKGYAPQLLAPVDIKHDFAEYHSSYEFKDGVLTAQRQLMTKLREIPAAERADYKSFLKSVTDAWGLYTQLQNGSAPALAAKTLDPKAVELVSRSREAFLKNDSRAGIDYLEQALEVDPTFEMGWMILASYRLSLNDMGQGIDALRKALALNPPDIQPFKTLAYQLMDRRQEAEAMEVWRALLRGHPDDGEVHANLGILLMNQKQYQDAATEFQAAVKAEPTKAFMQAQLGRAYIQLKQVDKAMAAFNSALALKRDPFTLNEAAWDLAESDAHLSEAESWAQEAVRAKEDESAVISLDALTQSNLGCMNALAAFWDTLGWVYFKEGKLESAEKYLEAAWNLSQGHYEAEHLGKLYEKEGKKAAASHQLALAKTLKDDGAGAPHMLRRDGSYVASLSRPALEELSQMRRIKLGKLSPTSGSAEFWILFGSGSKVEQAKFISGDEKMKPFGPALQSAKFNVLYPDDHLTKILRRGVMVCEDMNLGCDFTVYPVDTVNSLE